MLGVRWKEAKSRLVLAIRYDSKSHDFASILATLVPDTIKTTQKWRDFSREKLFEEFEFKSKKYREIREKNKIPHTMSTKEHARLTEKLKKFAAQGTLASTDPASLLHHVPFGEDTWKVWVDVPLEPQAHLWMDTFEACII